MHMPQSIIDLEAEQSILLIATARLEKISHLVNNKKNRYIMRRDTASRKFKTGQIDLSAISGSSLPS